MSQMFFACKRGALLSGASVAGWWAGDEARGAVVFSENMYFLHSVMGGGIRSCASGELRCGEELVSVWYGIGSRARVWHRLAVEPSVMHRPDRHPSLDFNGLDLFLQNVSWLATLGNDAVL